MSCGVGCRCGSDPALLWLWFRPVAIAPNLGTSVCCGCGHKKAPKKCLILFWFLYPSPKMVLVVIIICLFEAIRPQNFWKLFSSFQDTLITCFWKDIKGYTISNFRMHVWNRCILKYNEYKSFQREKIDYIIKREIRMNRMNRRIEWI